MKIKVLLLTLFLSISLSATVYAEEVDMNEQNILGNKHRDGQGVEQDYKQAVHWYKKASLQGNDKAQNNLGNMYRKGRGVEQDYKQAVHWYKKASLQGNGKAQNNLGNRYRYGQGVEQDYKQAVHWYKKASLQGNGKAQNNLGNRYRKGQGVKQDYKQAVHWYKKASLQGDDKAQNNLGNMYRKGQGVERDMNKAAFWIKKAKEQSNHGAIKNWSKHKLWKYENIGEGSNAKAITTIEEAEKDYEAKNYKIAFDKFYLFAKAGNPIAQWYLGMMYIRGKGVSEDKKKGFEWMSKSAEQGDRDAQYQLGLMYRLGVGVEQDSGKGNDWMLKAEAQGHKKAEEYLDKLRLSICPSGVGTGFVVSKDGVIATAEHVVTSKNGKGVECGCKKIEVDGLEASIIAKDEATDTAIIKINKTYEDVASLSDRPLVKLEDIVVIGWPEGHRYFQNFISSTPGNVSGMAGYMDDITEFRHTAPSHQGNSGGPVVALSDGKVVGIVSSGLNAKPGERVEFQNLNFAKRISILREMMNAKRIPITSKKILPRNKLIEHYEDKVTKFIKCIN